MENFDCQIISDLHLEFHPTVYPRIKRVAPNIALCGDIGNPTARNFQAFFAYLSREFERVFFVPGNHEYYSARFTMAQLDELMARICHQWPNIYYLNNSAVQVGRLTIIGSTLWSYIPETLASQYQRQINNFRWIRKTESQILEPKDTNILHQQAVEFLARTIRQSQQCLILTHYPPLYDGIRSRHGRGFEYAYYNHLPELFSPKILAWAYGHTHQPVHYRVKNTLIISNPRGYDDEALPFTSNKVIGLHNL